jgi:predicted O-methyltransferase YrrM
MPVTRWIDDDHLRIDGTAFSLWGASDHDDAIKVFKRRSQVERYLRCADEFHGGRIMEVGFFRGGSTAFLAAILDPEKLLAIDVATERNTWLDGWLDERDQADRVRLHYGVDQADRAAIVELISREFGDGPLDLVIDDASHQLSPTTQTFNILFPRLRPGGLYIIEDWSWHLVWMAVARSRPELIAEAIEKRAGQHPTEDSGDASSAEQEMWRLVLRLAIACGTHEELVSDVEMIRGLAAVRRGSVALDVDDFDLAHWVADLPA